MNHFLTTAIMSATVLVSASAFAAKPDKTDHPLVSPYAGSSVYSKDVKQFDEYRVFKGWDKALEVNFEVQHR